MKRDRSDTPAATPGAPAPPAPPYPTRAHSAATNPPT